MKKQIVNKTDAQVIKDTCAHPEYKHHFESDLVRWDEDRSTVGGYFLPEVRRAPKWQMQWQRYLQRILIKSERLFFPKPALRRDQHDEEEASLH